MIVRGYGSSIRRLKSNTRRGRSIYKNDTSPHGYDRSSAPAHVNTACYARPTNTEHHRDEIVHQRQAFVPAAIKAHEKPTAEPSQL